MLRLYIFYLFWSEIDPSVGSLFKEIWKPWALEGHWGDCEVKCYINNTEGVISIGNILGFTPLNTEDASVGYNE